MAPRETLDGLGHLHDNRPSSTDSLNGQGTGIEQRGERLASVSAKSARRYASGLQ
jgi:hypothetical protein